jgi:hypothetical protein
MGSPEEAKPGGQILDYGSFTHRQATTSKRCEIPYHKKFFLTIFFPPRAGSFAAARATLTCFATCWIFGLVNKARNDLHESATRHRTTPPERSWHYHRRRLSGRTLIVDGALNFDCVDLNAAQASSVSPIFRYLLR